MKNTFRSAGHVLALALLMTMNSHAASPPAPPPAPQSVTLTTAEAPPTKEIANYTVRVQWTDAAGVTNHLQVLTTEGQFSLDSLQTPVKINNSDVPTTVKLQGTLKVLSPEKGRINLFLGRTVPYVTGTSEGATGRTTSSYQQLQVGLSSTFGVTFGKSQVIQVDASGEVSILVNRLD